MSQRIDDYLNDLRKNLGHMDREERDAVLAEVEDHLLQESERLQAANPKWSNEKAALNAIESFGPADEIGVAYGGSKDTVGVINQVTGERILEVAAVTGRVAGKVAVVGGRGLKGLLKFAGIAALVIVGVATILVVAGLFFAGTVATVFQDDIREAVPRPLYGYNQYWGGATDVQTSTTTERFDVRGDVKEFWIDMDIDSSQGCAQILLTDPSGDIRYDSGTVCNGDHASREFNFSEEGEWTIRYSYTAYAGQVVVEAWYFQSAN